MSNMPVLSSWFSTGCQVASLPLGLIYQKRRFETKVLHYQVTSQEEKRTESGDCYSERGREESGGVSRIGTGRNYTVSSSRKHRPLSSAFGTLGEAFPCPPLTTPAGIHLTLPPATGLCGSSACPRKRPAPVRKGNHHPTSPLAHRCTQVAFGRLLKCPQQIVSTALTSLSRQSWGILLWAECVLR